MILSDRDIRDALAARTLGISPCDPDMIQPSSVDMRLDWDFRVFDSQRHPCIDPSRDQPDLTRPVTVEEGEPFVLHPGQFALASTYETVTLPDDLVGHLEGKSSLGRLGLVVHSTAGYIDPGFTGTITLELSNMAALPILLWPGMRIGQLALHQMTSPAEFPYGSPSLGSKYQGQQGPTPSRSHRNWR